ncbi:MAG: M20 family metallo-hydrolase [Chromatiales bacterium]|jgi:beta-ureidopropionase / N-carbamoyl-L-amino-acid hydrolase|nr:M20 family metallo-hydrolase [Chromatiales bacterium]
MARINGDRLLADLHHLRSFGSHGNGVIRPTLSPTDMQSREWLMGRMRDAGLVTRMDGVSNVFGCSPNAGPALLVGSHSDTQPRGGWLDGALGVIYGLEIARAFIEGSNTSDLAVDAVSLADEEGTFLGCLGSRSLCGILEDSEFEAVTNAQGITLSKALADVGLASVERPRLDRQRYVGYLEAHIEQGPYLEEAGNQIGVVTSIVGIRACTVRFAGEQNHAGTTPMNRRKDAGVALFEFATELRRRFQMLAGDRTVWTIGNVALYPGAASIIPGEAELMLQFRDPDNGRLETMMGAVARLAEEASAADGVQVHVAASREPILPTHMDENFQQHIAAAAERHAPDRWKLMQSAAGHDPMVLSHHLPCAMLFIPSINGVSHDFAEDSHEVDIVAGCQVLADAAESILRSRQLD